MAPTTYKYTTIVGATTTTTTTTVQLDPADDRSGEILATGAFFLFFIVLVTVLRLYGRLHLMKLPLALDDVLICIASVFGIGFLCVEMISCKYGAGKHFFPLSLESKSTYQFSVWLACSFYMCGMGFVKFAMLALYWRLSPSQGFRNILMFMFLFVGLLTVSNVLVVVFQCKPIVATWDLRVRNGTCINIIAFYYSNSALNILTDFAVYVLPMRMLWNIQLPIRQKISLCGIFGLGAIACIASVVRVANIPLMARNGDHSWNIVNAMIWSIVEMGVSILAASFPSLKVLVKCYFPRLLGSDTLDKASTLAPAPPNSGKSLELRTAPPRRLYPADSLMTHAHPSLADLPAGARDNGSTELIIGAPAAFDADAASACTADADADAGEVRPHT
ncbi:hypothetical protein EDC01DRAFT_235044 [Geopyxis carbonaria]|nr:hypothetical protein EDC01DRAFT_235044 [Geopyxis carbonaria]